MEGRTLLCCLFFAVTIGSCLALTELRKLDIQVKFLQLKLHNCTGYVDQIDKAIVGKRDVSDALEEKLRLTYALKLRIYYSGRYTRFCSQKGESVPSPKIIYEGKKHLIDHIEGAMTAYKCNGYRTKRQTNWGLEVELIDKILQALHVEYLTCLKEKDDCSNNTCLNGATCVDGIQSYSCQCTSGYGGKTCKIDLDDCESMPCQNNSTCLDTGPNQFQCQCQPGYSGKTCDKVCSPVKSIGAVEYVADISSFYGAWMKDVAFPNSQKIYVIRFRNNVQTVRQYVNMAAFKSNNHEKQYTLPTKISGSGMIYNGMVYYSKYYKTTMYQYNMATGQSKTLVLTGSGYGDICDYQSSGNSGGDETAIDIEVDEKGLWFIYGIKDQNCRFAIAKIDPVSFTVESTQTLPWSRSKQTTGEAFMKCGKLYIIDNASNKPTYVSYVFDTETDQGSSLGSTEIVYPNTYPNTLYMSYNINDKNLYVWHSSPYRAVRYPVM